MHARKISRLHAQVSELEKRLKPKPADEREAERRAQLMTLMQHPEARRLVMAASAIWFRERDAATAKALFAKAARLVFSPQPNKGE